MRSRMSWAIRSPRLTAHCMLVFMSCVFWTTGARTLEIDIAVVEKDNTDVTPVVLIDNTSASVDEILDGQPRARGDTSVGAVRNGDGQVGFGDTLATSRDYDILRTAMSRK